MSNAVLDAVKWLPGAWAKVKEWAAYVWSFKEQYPFVAGIVAGLAISLLLRIIF